MSPVVRYMLLCDEVRPDLVNPSCTHIDCLMSNIVSLQNPPFPLLREKICVYLVLAECQGRGIAQIRVAYSDSEPEQLLFGSPEHAVDFSGRSPLESLGIVFRIKPCLFPHSGRYSVQFWYDNEKLAERPLQLKVRPGDKNDPPIE
jgi:hypothetical protein